MKYLLNFSLFFFVIISYADQRMETVKTFTNKYCLDCHDSDLTKGGLDLSKFDLSISSLEEEHAWSYSYGRVDRMEMPPSKKKKQPSAEERLEFKKALSSLLEDKILTKQKKYGRTIVRRLTRVEYENTLRDLLHLPNLDVKLMLPEDSISSGFDNVAHGQTLSHINIKKYLEAADYALDMALAMGEKPDLYKFEMNMLDTPRLNPFRERKHKHPVPFDKENKVYHFRSKGRDGPHPIEVMGLKIPYDGVYSVKVRAYGSRYDYKNIKPLPVKDPNTEHILSLYIGKGNQLDQAAVFSLPNDKCDDYLEFTFPMVPGDKIVPKPSTLTTMPVKPPTFLPDIKNSVGVKDFVVEGPLLDQWPTRSHKFLYGDLEQVSWSPEISAKFTPVNLLRYKVSGPGALSKAKKEALEKLTIISKNPEKDAKYLLRRFMTKAFRRPVEESEVNEFYAFFESKLNEGYDFRYSLKTTYKLVLCDPSFLYFKENVGELDDYALANRLSYFLWKSMPDEKLTELANQGKLKYTNTLKEQVNRMLNDKKSERFVKDFINQWLDIKNFFATSPDIELYPEYWSDHWIEHSMMKESYAFFNKLIADNLSAKNIIDSDFVMINRRLAEHYGIDGIKGDEIRPVKVPKGIPRGGFLTQGSVLKVTANGTTTSPVNRGVWMAERILGVHIPPPPANVPAIEEDSNGTSSIKERLAKHRENESCAVCHNKIDPIGFSLEGFDVMGAERPYYRIFEGGKEVNKKVHYVPVKYKQAQNVGVSSIAPNGQEFSGIEEFKKIIMKDHKKVTKHFLKKLITFATGSGIQFTDQAEISRIMQHADKDDGVRSLIQHVVLSQLFRNK